MTYAVSLIELELIFNLEVQKGFYALDNGDFSDRTLDQIAEEAIKEHENKKA